MGRILVYLLTFFDIIVSDLRHNLRNEKYKLILSFPVCQCVGILTYFSLSFEPSCIFTISTFLLLPPTLTDCDTAQKVHNTMHYFNCSALRIYS